MPALIGASALAALLVLSVGAHMAGAVELAVPPHGCIVVSIDERQLVGAPVHISLVAHGGGGGCARTQFRVSGHESHAGCDQPTVVEPDASLSHLTFRPWTAAHTGSTHLTIHSSCGEAAVLWLAFSSSSSGSHGGGAVWRRRLRAGLLSGGLQGPNSYSPSNNTSSANGAPDPAPGNQASDGSTRNSIADKYVPPAELPLPGAPGNRTQAGSVAAGGSPAPSIASTAPAPAPDSSLNTSGNACCCRYSSSPLPFQPDTYTIGCCCGAYSACCSSTNLLSRICGGGNTCGVILIIVAVICVFVFSVCLMGGFCWRRRATGRRDQTAAPNMSAARRTRSALDVECETLLALPEEKQAESRVCVPDGEALGAAVECSICLENIEVAADNWRLFPCPSHHGCCAGCLADLVRHSRRRTPALKRVVLCPLCRVLSIVPDSMLPADVLEIVNAPPPPSSEFRRSSRRSSRRRRDYVLPIAETTAEPAREGLPAAEPAPALAVVPDAASPAEAADAPLPVRPAPVPLV